MRSKNQKNDNINPKITSKELKDVEELVLSTCKLKFCSEQLQNLNYIFTQKLNEHVDQEYVKVLALAKSVTERLIQRLLCGVGLLDSRFASKFLVALKNDNNNINEKLDYIIRLDSLSTPGLYKDDVIPKYSIIEGNGDNSLPGYAKIRLHSSCMNDWKDFVNSRGFLRRDKIQAKIIELLSIAASSVTPSSPLEVDESLMCGSPGKVVDPLTLHHILRIPSENHVFYGPPGKTPRFPDLRDFKLAIVDDPSGIRMRVGFHSPALSSISINVRLLIGIGFDAWPSTSNFPFRIPLGHSDCVLYYKAAQTGLYLIGYGVHSFEWQIRLPAAECMLETHYSPTSNIRCILKTLSVILREINEDYRQHQISYKILNGYSLRTTVFSYLEQDLSSPTDIVLQWSQKYLSTHVLRILDHLIKVVWRQKQPNYFLPKANVLTNPGHLTEDDYMIESNKVHAIVLKFFDESLISLKKCESFNTFITRQKIECTLLNKWKDLIDGLTPPPSTRGRRICFAGSKLNRDIAFTQYTSRQLEYIGIILKHLLIVRQNVLLVSGELEWTEQFKLMDVCEDPVEDIIYILVTVIEQARDKYLECLSESEMSLVHKKKLKRQIDSSIENLIEMVRKEREICNMEYLDDIILVKIILKWLYKGLDYKKYLAPVLRPYLRILFFASHGASWHLEAIKNDEFYNEIKALGAFTKLVNKSTITPAQGLVDAVKKNWNWAKNMLKAIESENLRLVFITGKTKFSRHILSLPPNVQNSHSSLEKSLSCAKLHCLINSQATLSKWYQNTIDSKLLACDGTDEFSVFQTDYWTLKTVSPLTIAIRQSYRLGKHRCMGDVFKTLLAMKKFNILQEVSTLLPYQERLEMLEAIQNLTNEKAKQTFNKKKCNTLVQLANSRRKINPELSPENLQKYTPKEESAGIREVITIDSTSVSEIRLTKVDRLGIEKTFKSDKGSDETLIGSCRAARIRNDTNILQFGDYFKIQSLKKRSSF